MSWSCDVCGGGHSSDHKGCGTQRATEDLNETLNRIDKKLETIVEILLRMERNENINRCLRL